MGGITMRIRKGVLGLGAEKTSSDDWSTRQQRRLKLHVNNGSCLHSELHAILCFSNSVFCWYLRWVAGLFHKKSHVKTYPENLSNLSLEFKVNFIIFFFFYQICPSYFYALNLLLLMVFRLVQNLENRWYL